MVCWRGEKNKGKEKKEKAKKKIHVWLQGRATDRMQDAQVGCCVFTELPVWSSRYRRMRQYIAFVHIHSTYLLCPPSSFLCSGAIVTACPGFTKQVRNPIGLEELFKLATECISQVTISKNINKVNPIYHHISTYPSKPITARVKESERWGSNAIACRNWKMFGIYCNKRGTNTHNVSKKRQTSSHIYITYSLVSR